MNTFLDKLKELDKEATPRLWAYTQCADICEIVYESSTKTSGPFSEHDARLICTIRSCLPELLAVVLAAKGIKQREDIGGYGHEGIPDLLIALAALEEEV